MYRKIYFANCWNIFCVFSVSPNFVDIHLKLLWMLFPSLATNFGCFCIPKHVFKPLLHVIIFLHCRYVCTVITWYLFCWRHVRCFQMFITKIIMVRKQAQVFSPSAQGVIYRQRLVNICWMNKLWNQGFSTLAQLTFGLDESLLWRFCSLHCGMFSNTLASEQ